MNIIKPNRCFIKNRWTLEGLIIELKIKQKYFWIPEISGWSVMAHCLQRFSSLSQQIIVINLFIARSQPSLLQRRVLLRPGVLQPGEAAALHHPRVLQDEQLWSVLLPQQVQLHAAHHLLQHRPQPSSPHHQETTTISISLQLLGAGVLGHPGHLHDHPVFEAISDGESLFLLSDQIRSGQSGENQWNHKKVSMSWKGCDENLIENISKN